MKVSNRIALSKLAIFAGLAAFGWMAACNSDDSTSPAVPAGVETLRASLDPYASFTLAKNAGYATALTDCMSNGDEGAWACTSPTCH